MECRLSSRKLFPLLSESKELNTRESLSKVGVPKIKSLTIFPQLEPFLVSGLHDLELPLENWKEMSILMILTFSKARMHEFPIKQLATIAVLLDRALAGFLLQ